MGDTQLGETPVFERILCGVDGTPSSLTAEHLPEIEGVPVRLMKCGRQNRLNKGIPGHSDSRVDQ